MNKISKELIFILILSCFYVQAQNAQGTIKLSSSQHKDGTELPAMTSSISLNEVKELTKKLNIVITNLYCK